MESSRVGHVSYLLRGRGDSISIGMADVSLVCLEAGGLALGVGEPRKVKRLPSLLEGPAFWHGAMVGGRSSQRCWRCGVTAKRGCWWCTGGRSSQCALFTRLELKGRTTLLSVGGGPSCLVN